MPPLSPAHLLPLVIETAAKYRAKREDTRSRRGPGGGGGVRNAVETDASGRLCFALFFFQPGEKRGSLPSAVWDFFHFFSFSLSLLYLPHQENSHRSNVESSGRAARVPVNKKKVHFHCLICVCVFKKNRKNPEKKHIFSVKDCLFPFGGSEGGGAELRRLTASNRCFPCFGWRLVPDRDEDEDEET